MTAVVSSAGKINKSGLIDAVVEKGIELKRETVEDVVTRYNRVAESFAARGWNLNTDLVHLRAIIIGTFFGKKYDPAKNSLYVSASQGVEIRKDLADTEVEILGEMADLIHIFQVVNLQTKVADGTLTRAAMHRLKDHTSNWQTTTRRLVSIWRTSKAAISTSSTKSISWRTIRADCCYSSRLTWRQACTD
jgi:hypothetical protein